MHVVPEPKRGARITVRWAKLGEEPAEKLDGTPEERIERAVALTRAAWAMTGRPWPAPGSARHVVRFVPRES